MRHGVEEWRVRVTQDIDRGIVYDDFPEALQARFHDEGAQVGLARLALDAHRELAGGERALRGATEAEGSARWAQA